MTSASALDIIIVNFNTREVLGDCLAALHRCPPSRPHQIIVVDNASGDGSVEFLPSTWPGVRVIALERNVGFGIPPTISRCAHETSAPPLVLFLNSDTIAEAGALDTLCDRPRGARIQLQQVPRLIDRARGRGLLATDECCRRWPSSPRRFACAGRRKAHSDHGATSIASPHPSATLTG